MTTQSTTQEATGEECCKNHSKLCNTITGCACGNCKVFKPLSSEPSQEKLCKKNEHCFDKDKYHLSHCAKCCICKPTEVPQEGWEIVLDDIFEDMNSYTADKLHEDELFDRVKAFIRQKLSQAEQKGYERGYEDGHNSIARIHKKPLVD